MGTAAGPRTTFDGEHGASRRAVIFLAVGLSLAVVSGCEFQLGPPDATSAPTSSTTSTVAPTGATSSTDETTVATSSDDPPTSGSGSVDDSVVIPDDTLFTTVEAEVIDPYGEIWELCVWLADSDPERTRGLMEVTDLGDRDAMAFVYTEPVGVGFWMKNMVIPISIAFFDADGVFISSLDLEPCTEDPCTVYPTPPGFAIALEVPLGGLADIGVEPESEVTISDVPCASSSSSPSDA